MAYKSTLRLSLDTLPHKACSVSQAMQCLKACNIFLAFYMEKIHIVTDGLLELEAGNGATVMFWIEVSNLRFLYVQ